LKKLIDSEKIETSKSGDVYSVILLKGEGIIGEATSINGKIVHLVGMKVDKNPEKNENPTYGNVSTRTSDILRSIGGPRLGSYSSNRNMQ
jgi:hypothetical protein